MAEVSGPAQSARRAKGNVPQLVVDPDAVVLDPEKIIVKHTDDGGYFCLGIGPSAEFLRAIDEDDRFNEAIDKAAVALGKLSAPIASNPDPFLRRLAAAVTLAKAGFDPDQARDDHGRWTGEGAGAGSSSSSAASSASAGAPAAAFMSRSVVEVPELVPALRALATRLLGGPVSAAVAFFGTLFIPTNRSLISEGTVPDAPDLGYYFDRDGGDLILSRTNADGSKQVLFSGKPGPDDVFRDKDGNVVARFLDGTAVVVDTSAVPGYRSRSSAQPQVDEDEDSAPQPNIPAANDNAPKLCPAPSLDRFRGEIDPNSDEALYEAFIGEHVNGFALPTGFGISMLNPTTGKTVVFDNCQITTGIMIEAKSGYDEMLQKWRDTGNPMPWKMIEFDMLDQAQRQLQAAGGRPIEWHFSNQEVADYVRDLFAKERPGITVIYTPTPPGLLSKYLQARRFIGPR